MSKTKKRIIALVVVIVVLAGLITGMFAGMSLKASAKGNLFGTPGELSPTVVREFTEDEAAPEGFVLAYREGNLSMYVNKTNCNVAIGDSATGKIWSTMPLKEDTSAFGDVKNRMSSQLYLQYYNKDSEVFYMDSYSYAVKGEQFEIEPIEKGIRITYTIGKKTITKDMLPVAINKNRFEDIVLKNLEGNDKAKETLLSQYTLTKISDLGELLQQVYIDRYPTLDVNKEYYLLNNLCPVYMYEPLYNSLFMDAGYTMDDFNKDNEENGIEVEINEPVQFVVPIEFEIDGGDFLSRVITSKITGPSSYTLTHITLNEFFGAGSTEDQGYMLMPDGSGSIINFNNGKTSTTIYNLPVYSKDASYKTSEGSDEEPATVLAPIFGIKNNDAAFLAVIEEGDTHATICAEISGKTHSFNQVYARFNVRPVDTMSVSTNKGMKYNNRYQGNAYQGDCTIRYLFTESESADYVGMAKEYKKYLTDNGELVNKDTSTVPFITELLGQTKVQKSFLGVPVTTQEALTTFEEAEIIANLLYEKGIKNGAIKYSSWISGSGLYSSAASEASLSGKLGGKKDLLDLSTNLSAIGSSVYLNAPISNVYDSAPNFNQWSYANRLTYNQISNQRFYDVATYQQVRSKYYTISARYLRSYIEKYLNRVEKTQISNLWFDDLAADLNSDFRKNNVVDRQVAKDYIVESLAYLSSNSDSIGLDSPNVYAWKYADKIVNLPLTTSGNRMTDEEVPFFPIVLSGSVSYTGRVINTSGQDRTEMLKALETGAGLYFKWIYSDNTEVMDMEGEEPLELYSLYYGDWVDTAADYYKQLTEKAEGLIGTEITAHEKLQYNVYKTTYEGGIVIVNYNDYEVTIGDVTVGAKDFEVIK
ncbi:MAG: hypothetical protein J6K88_05290 [Oscillospiraceae bacterium]|nr:hypothetical protein [Oscillospiraceae bacterium]